MRSGLTFFLDRGLGSRTVANGLRASEWSITTMDERYGTDASQDVDDVDWIRDASGRGEILLSKDRAIAKRPLEAEAIYYSSARVLVVASANITGPQMLTRLLSNASSIERLCDRNGPWVFGVYEDRVGAIRLNYP